MTKWVAYTDGACAPSNPGPAAWGAVVIAPDGGEVAAHSGFIGRGTNQIAEITAAIEGLTRTPEGTAVELVSDSQYVLKGLTEWRKGWERKGYRNSKGEPVANLALWKKLFAAADKRKVTTRWVRGHNGDHHNEQADRLATAALRAARAVGPVAAMEPPAAMQRGAADYTLPLE
ncbi:MAG: ribonuclease HI [Lautropia sp.]|nr:ribonuclease HI [Lautropia sp.]